jgi:hypothetical protein
MKALLWMAIAMASGFSPEALAVGGRSLPSGADQISVVEKVYMTPRGEVHFVEVRGGHSALLRNNLGNLASFKEVRGSSQCDAWLLSSKQDALPGGCDFVFHDELTGGLYSVRSEEMEEGSLFQAVRGALNGQAMGGAIVAL